MKILYMNQGGGGHWGALKYSDYDLILLAESALIKEKFDLAWKSNDSLPVMSVQVNSSKGRLISDVTDLDLTSQHVRPLPTFTTIGDNIRVVFVHLKSGNEQAATEALITAINRVTELDQFRPPIPILWIGDFNRAKEGVMEEFGAKLVFAGGGQAKWDLDRAYISGDWSAYSWKPRQLSYSFADHGHVAIEFAFEKAAK